jgi:hypothetical protein
MKMKGRLNGDAKTTKTIRASLFRFVSRWRWPLIILGLEILILLIPFGEHLWNFREGTVNHWLSRQTGQAPNELKPNVESDFARAFGISADLSAEFERKLTENGRADSAEVERRIKAFSAYIQKHSAEFNADPASAVRTALRDPGSFGLSSFGAPPTP